MISDPAAIRRRIREFVARRFPLPEHLELGDELPLLETGVIDSLGILDMLKFLEATFGICLSDDELSPENFHSIETLVQFVDAKR